MLDTETKRKINIARDILVGKVPDPKSQVEQITIALIYKFMDDMDEEAEELGGEPSFFSGEYEKYSWRKIFNPGLGGFDMLNLYSEAIQGMVQNPNLPQLFRDIFKNAYLPYRDPETLKSFLKVINDFTYDHSERLGDAFEYLLSVLGSQGDAGQFRTPRHVIDFMTALISPKKNETILDPACGTAGFLISAYKHILKENSSNYNETDTHAFEQNNVKLAEITVNGKHYKGDKLTPDERARIIQNIKGYDISPDMVRLSLVNMYLHGFTSPHIYEYDTLTSEERWNEFYDVILANPPFMSPKGGIRPHKRFSIQSKRSEVLFVDYMAEHLTPTGRAAIIVPEGIIFQSGKAYKSLRKMLVENNYLVGVISLPAGVFNPYSGVKTSILWLDKTLAKKTDKILFAKIENDGFDLGAQRRPIKHNDFPSVFRKMTEYRDKLMLSDNIDFENEALVSVVEKEKIAENDEYNLSGERYRATRNIDLSDFPHVTLGECCNILNGSTPSKQDETYWENGTIPWFTIEDIRNQGRIITKTFQSITEKALKETSVKLLPSNTVLLCCTASVGEYAIAEIQLTTNQQFNGLVVKEEFKDKLNPRFLYHLSSTFKDELIRISGQTSFNFVSVGVLKTLQIPLPPLSVQEEIVAEIESYQKIIDGARQVVENYKPKIDIDPEWEMVELGEVCTVNGKAANPKDLYSDWFVYIDISSVENGTGAVDYNNKLKVEEAPSRARRIIQKGDILLSTVRPNLKAFGYVDKEPERFVASTGFAVLSTNMNRLIPRFLYYMIFQNIILSQMINRMGKGSYPSINQKDVKHLKIPLPQLDIQRRIVEQIEKEYRAVSLNRMLIKSYEKRIKERISKVWGE